jgi:8-oxo-dGTP diphosphatase
MRWEDQRADRQDRYAVIPRTLTFLLRCGQVLLLRGGEASGAWAGRLNGVGGHLEPGEGVLQGALREVQEETGLSVKTLDLRALVHITPPSGGSGVLLFVFVGRAPTWSTSASSEGRLEWHSLSALPRAELVDDLPLLLERITDRQSGRWPVYGHYSSDGQGRMQYRFSPVGGDGEGAE